MSRKDRHRIDRLPLLDIEALRALWHQTFKSSPPAFARRDFLIRILAYGVQEGAHGRLSKSSTKALREFLSDSGVATASSVGALDAAGLRPGSRLIRSWGGATHEVMVMDRGFAYRGTAYSSLSEIAKRITGAHWSGPRFFGVNRNRPKAKTGRAHEHSA